MALTDINLEQLTPRTTAARTNIALLRNDIASLDNGIEFGDWIKQVFALMIQADITGSVGYGLLETDISENVRTNVLVLNAQESLQVIDGETYIDGEIIVSTGNLNFYYVYPHGCDITLERPRLSIIAGEDCRPLFSNQEGASSTDKLYLSTDIGNTYTAITTMSELTSMLFYEKLTGIDDVYWSYGRSELYHSTNKTSWTLDRASGYFPFGAFCVGVAGNGKTGSLSETNNNDKTIKLALYPVATGSDQQCLSSMGYNQTPYLVTFPLNGEDLQTSIAYSPTLDKFVTVSPNGGLEVTINDTSTPFFTTTVNNDLAGDIITWEKDAFYICDETNSITRTTDLSTFTSHTLPTGVEAYKVKQLKRMDGETSTYPWFIILCNEGKIYLTTDFTTFYLKNIGSSNDDWRDFCMLNESTGMMIGSSDAVVVITF